MHTANTANDYTPSLFATVRRYWWIMALLAMIGVVAGTLVARRQYTPSAGLSIGVEAATAGVASSDIDPQRMTAEVAAALKSPTVLGRAEAKSSSTVDAISTTYDEVSSIVSVTVSAASADDALRAAAALLESYEETRAEAAQRAVSTQLAPIDAALVRLRGDQRTLSDQLKQIITTTNPAGPSSYPTGVIDELNTRYAGVTAQIATYEAERDAAIRNAALSPFTVFIVDAPAAAAAESTLALRYIPAAVVAFLLLGLVGLAAQARRRPWLSEPDDFAELFDAPLLGAQSTARDGGETIQVAGRLAAVATQKVVTSSKLGVVVVLPVPGSNNNLAHVRRVTDAMVSELGRALDTRGLKVSIAEVGEEGATLSDIDGNQFEFHLGPENVTVNELSSWISSNFDVDVVVARPALPLEGGVCFDLLAISDATFVLCGAGADLASVTAIRRSCDALERKPAGVVVHR